jgi:antitoxin (DNA-binding transcriptional repressor) of toxin-antitoxin stability system
MQTLTLQEAQCRLAEIIARLTPGEEVLITRDNHPVARIVGEAVARPQPVPGRGKGMLTVVSEDDEHLKDWAEYMP